MLISKSKEYAELEESQRKQSKVQLSDAEEVVAGKEMVITFSTILPAIIPEKLDDPGSFVLPCRIGKSIFERCLCDLGAGVNLMPLSVSKRLGITDFRPSRISLILADRSVRYPVGLAEDVHVRVGNFYIRTDFTVLELDKEPQDPLILGRPFLNTAGAIIDVRRSKINLQIGDYSLEFDMRETRENPTIDGQAFSIDTNDESSDMCVKKCSGWSEVKEVLDGDTHIPIKKIAAKDMVKQKRIKGDPHIALIPLRCVGDTIEYKVQCKGTSKPFSKARSILTSEWKEKGRKAVKSVVGKVLKLKLNDWGPCFGASSRTHTH
ncbi:Aspartic peptidase domain superfamily [Arabidopsis thaliana x Arabidopsis arenosa]|uniref:Aspartic peptidase domain superfamily n=1 Tax=Arabidopsis thaliana x Arabidopsis arenosa TaxID=1240361 RepID=A0A8T2A5S4_9BRAS|nr:Aspartic peptidase domain superfamily [Arabidopsis thaliana x Arabidopsis arenosa]